MGRFPRSITHILGVIMLLALAKPFGGITPIVMGEIFYYLIIIALCFHFICHLINLVWRLRASVKWWCMIFELLWMSIPIGWCYKWMWQIHLTPSCVKPFSKSFMWQEANYFCFSILSTIFMPINCLCSLVIIPLEENYLLSFHLWACIKVTRLLGFYLLLFIFVFRDCYFSFVYFPFVGRWHSHPWPYFLRSFFFWPFCFQTHLNGFGCPTLQVHSLVPF